MPGDTDKRLKHKLFSQRALVHFTTVAALAFFSVPASAAVITYSSQAALAAAGSIAFTHNFDDFGGGFNFPGDPFTRDSVTYTSTQNLTVGPGAGYSVGAVRTVITNNYWSPFGGSLAGTFDLFGFNVAVTNGPIDITLTTNQNTYVFSGLTVGDGNPNFTYVGYQATGAGEYFTDFRIDTQGSGFLPGMTDVSAGIAGQATPEPSTFALMGIGSLIACWVRRRS